MSRSSHVGSRVEVKRPHWDLPFHKLDYRGQTMNRTVLPVVCLVLSCAVSTAVAQDEYTQFKRTKIENKTGQVMDVILVGRRNCVLDRNEVVMPGVQTPTSQGYLYGGWRAACWFDSNTGELIGSEMTTIHSHDQIIPIELKQRVFVLPAFSCTGDDPNQSTVVQRRHNNRKMITDVFRAHMPAANVVVYGDSEWPDTTNVTTETYGYRSVDIREALDTCPARPNETLVVYWNGHGGVTGTQHFFVMRDTSVFRDTVRDWMKAKGPRLSILVTDTCARAVSAQAVAVRAVTPPTVVEPLFYELFLKPRGCVNLNSTSSGHFAFGANPIGSYFTLAFASQNNLDGLSNTRGYLWMNAGTRRNWPSVIGGVQMTLTDYFKHRHPTGYTHSDGTIQTDQRIWTMNLPDAPDTNLYSGCKINNTIGFPLDVMIIDRDSVVRTYNIAPYSSKEVQEDLRGGAKVVAWWRNDDAPVNTGIDTKVIVIGHDGQEISI